MPAPAFRPFAAFCIAALLAALPARPFPPRDFDCGYEWRGIDFRSDQPFSRPVEIVPGADSGRGLLPLEIYIGNYVVSATFSIADRTVAIPAGQFLCYDPTARMDVFFYHGRWDSGVNIPLSADAVFSPGEAGFLLPPDETIVIGNDSRGLLMCGRENILAPLSGITAPVAAPLGEARFFSLDGRALSGTPRLPGIYVRVCGSDRSLLIVK